MKIPGRHPSEGKYNMARREVRGNLTTTRRKLVSLSKLGAMWLPRLRSSHRPNGFLLSTEQSEREKRQTDAVKPTRWQQFIFWSPILGCQNNTQGQWCTMHDGRILSAFIPQITWECSWEDPQYFFCKLRAENHPRWIHSRVREKRSTFSI